MWWTSPIPDPYEVPSKCIPFCLMWNWTVIFSFLGGPQGLAPSPTYSSCGSIILALHGLLTGHSSITKKQCANTGLLVIWKSQHVAIIRLSLGWKTLDWPGCSIINVMHLKVMFFVGGPLRFTVFRACTDAFRPPPHSFGISVVDSKGTKLRKPMWTGLQGYHPTEYKTRNWTIPNP